jgi:hypothetical protein
MSLQTQGFLSPEVDTFRLAVRSTPRLKVWFDFADELIRYGLDTLRVHETSRNNQELLISGFFVRAHQSFQAAIILCERGMIPDARGVIRSAVETAIASAALAADTAFVDRLIGADSQHKLTYARVLLEDADYKGRYSLTEIAKLEEVKKNIEAIDKNSPRAPRNINWKDVADKHCKDLYIALYRLLSSDGTHTTIDVMDRYFESDALGQITALKMGPDHEGLDDTINAACLTFLWAANAFAQVFSKGESNQVVSDYLKEYRRLAGLQAAIEESQSCLAPT